jgi:hypothetical protein
VSVPLPEYREYPPDEHKPFLETGNVFASPAYVPTCREMYKESRRSGFPKGISIRLLAGGQTARAPVNVLADPSWQRCNDPAARA